MNRAQTYRNFTNRPFPIPEFDNFDLFNNYDFMGKIKLEGMEFFSYHGCFKEEQIIGAKYLVDLVVETDTSRAEVSDRLHDTVNYAALYSVVKEEMALKSFLIEHVAYRITERLRSSFDNITSIDLEISKVNPPVGGKMKEVSFVKHWEK